MMITGNPAGALVVASGAMSFAKGNGFQIASQVLGFVAPIAAGLYESSGSTNGAESSEPFDAGGHTVHREKSPTEWEGVVPDDLNLENPTGGSIHVQDSWGKGHYWADRFRNGVRYGHEVTDFLGEAGDVVPPPVVGNQIKRLYGTGSAQNVYLDTGLTVTDAHGRYRVTYLHIDPKTGAILDPAKYNFSGMLPHVHLQLEQRIGAH